MPMHPSPRAPTSRPFVPRVRVGIVVVVMAVSRRFESLLPTLTRCCGGNQSRSFLGLTEPPCDRASWPYWLHGRTHTARRVADVPSQSTRPGRGRPADAWPTPGAWVAPRGGVAARRGQRRLLRTPGAGARGPSVGGRARRDRPRAATRRDRADPSASAGPAHLVAAPITGPRTSPARLAAAARSARRRARVRPRPPHGRARLEPPRRLVARRLRRHAAEGAQHGAAAVPRPGVGRPLRRVGFGGPRHGRCAPPAGRPPPGRPGARRADRRAVDAQ